MEMSEVSTFRIVIVTELFIYIFYLTRIRLQRAIYFCLHGGQFAGKHRSRSTAIPWAKPAPKNFRQKTICHAKSRAVGAGSVWDYRSRHAMAYSTAVHPKIYWYPNKLQFVSWLEPPLPKSPKRCQI
jgi:hypothetical protein